jgi:hypothetical protein
VHCRSREERRSESKGEVKIYSKAVTKKRKKPDGSTEESRKESEVTRKERRYNRYINKT